MTVEVLLICSCGFNGLRLTNLLKSIKVLSKGNENKKNRNNVQLSSQQTLDVLSNESICFVISEFLDVATIINARLSAKLLKNINFCGSQLRMGDLRYRWKRRKGVGNFLQLKHIDYLFNLF